MKKRNITLVFLFLILFAISFVSAQGCDSSGWKGYGKFNENKTICVTCTTCDYINFSSTDPTGNVTIINQEMIQAGSTFCYEYAAEDLQQLGIFQIDGYSQLDTPLGLCFDITLSGRQISIWAYIMSISFVILLLIGLIWFNIKFNAKEREKLYKKIVLNYFKFSTESDKGNLVSAILYLIAFGVLKMIFVIYYFIILIFIFIFTEMVTAFGINTFAVLMPQILTISLWGLVIIGVFFFAIFFEIIKGLIRDIQDMLRGTYE